MELYYPPEYLALTPEQVNEIDNGCGPKKFGYLVPDKFYGLDISESCKIHDVSYALGKTQEDKYKADIEFLRNMLCLILQAGGFMPIKMLRCYRAMTYFLAVYEKGDEAFFVGKEREDGMDAE